MYEEEIHFRNCYSTVLADLTPVTLTFDPKINRVSLLPKMDVWTKFEKGRSMRSPVIDRKRFWHI